jgi:hypothetical protein
MMDKRLEKRQEELIHCELMGMRVGYADEQHATLRPGTRPDRLANQAAATIFRYMLDSCTAGDHPLEEKPHGLRRAIAAVI